MERRWTTEILTFSVPLWQPLPRPYYRRSGRSGLQLVRLEYLSRCFTSFELKKPATASKTFSEEHYVQPKIRTSISVNDRSDAASSAVFSHPLTSNHDNHLPSHDSVRKYCTRGDEDENFKGSILYAGVQEPGAARRLRE